MSTFPAIAAWRAACMQDAVLGVWAGPWSVCFAVQSDADVSTFLLQDGRMHPDGAVPVFTVRAPGAVWSKFLEPIPPRHHQGMFAMLYRVAEFGIDGEQLAFMQHAHVVRRVLEVGKWLALGNAAPAPVSLHPRGGVRPTPELRGGYVPLTARANNYQVYFETAGAGHDLLCLHTAGADGRQFHGLMADRRLTDGHRLVAFDLPWHGKSPPPEGAIPGS